MPDRIEGDFSVLEALTTLVERRKVIVICAIIGGGVAGAGVATRPPLFRAYASFVSQPSDQSRSGLAGIAGQFGIAMPGSGQGASPEYYARLVRSRSLLAAVARDSFQGPEMGKKVALPQLFELTGTDSAMLTEQTLTILQGMVRTSVSRQTGIIEISATTRWRIVSLAIVEALVREVNRFNQESRRVQAMAERQFVEGRLALATGELRAAEDRLWLLLRGNREIDATSELSLQRSRLMAELDRRRQVVTALAQAYEDVRLREVRNTPVITVVEPPTAPPIPEPRGRLKDGLLGLAVGVFSGCVLALGAESFRRRLAAGDTSVLAFVAAVTAVYGGAWSRLRRLPRRGS